MKVWSTCFNETVSAIQDPDRLAEDAASAGLISPPVKQLLLSGCGELPVCDRALTVLLTIDSRIRESPQLLCTHLIPVLRRQPGLDRVVSTLQTSCGESLRQHSYCLSHTCRTGKLPYFLEYFPWVLLISEGARVRVQNESGKK